MTAEPQKGREEVLEPIRRVLGWMRSLANSEGLIVCPDHGIAHTGKNAGAIVIACELARHDPSADRDDLFAFVCQQSEHLAAALQREGESTCFTFRPGRHDPYNCSNSVIDGGACSDALAEAVRTFGERMTPQQRERFTHASVHGAQTYLRYCIFDKGIPAQRAWAMTGTAAAWGLSKHDVLELAVTEGTWALEGIQHTDGSYPYHPVEWGAGHPGASDVSSFYQSRVTAFLLFSLERIGRDPRDEIFRRQLGPGLEFLLGLSGPDGIKCGLVEAKPWYWGANHEVASHPFDVYAFARSWHYRKRAPLIVAARRAFEAWRDHLEPNGRPRSHLPGPGRRRSYQCPVFWAGHASWMARSIEDLSAGWDDALVERGEGSGLELHLRHFPNADLVRVEDDAVCAWVRGARPEFNVAHGSPMGAGLLRVVDKRSGEELLGRCRLGAGSEGEWTGKSGWMSLARGWRSGKKEQRFSLWLARNAWRGGRKGEALKAPLRMFKEGVLAFGASRVGSAFSTEPSLRLLPDGVQIDTPLARRTGEPIIGSRLVRTFTVDGEGLCVHEELHDAGGARGMKYKRPSRALEYELEGRKVSYRLGNPG